MDSRIKNCVEELKRYFGMYPFDSKNNIVKGDYWFKCYIHNSYDSVTLKESYRLLGKDMINDEAV